MISLQKSSPAMITALLAAFSPALVKASATKHDVHHNRMIVPAWKEPGFHRETTHKIYTKKNKQDKCRCKKCFELDVIAYATAINPKIESFFKKTPYYKAKLEDAKSRITTTFQRIFSKFSTEIQKAEQIKKFAVHKGTIILNDTRYTAAFDHLVMRMECIASQKIPIMPNDDLKLSMNDIASVDSQSKNDESVDVLEENALVQGKKRMPLEEHLGLAEKLQQNDDVERLQRLQKMQENPAETMNNNQKYYNDVYYPHVNDGTVRDMNADDNINIIPRVTYQTTVEGGLVFSAKDGKCDDQNFGKRRKLLAQRLSAGESAL